MVATAIRAVAFASILLASAAGAQTPLSIAKQGYLFVGQHDTKVDGTDVINGQMYVEYQIPAKRTHRWPVVMVHGGGQSGTNFTGTPDGREGWAQYFLRRGYAVYVVDQVGRGRAAYVPEVYAKATSAGMAFMFQRFIAPEKYNLWPQAKLHTQWPGRPEAGDPVTDQFIAAQMPSISDFAQQQKLNRAVLVALLDRIGPAIILTHSQSGSFGWPVADDRPKLVKALLQSEPSVPPVHDVSFHGAPDWFGDVAEVKPWGLGFERLTYAPAPADVGAMSYVREDKADGPDLARCWKQAEPARQLPNLRAMPILIVTSQASYHAAYDHCTVKYLEQAGVKPSVIRLADVGITGNNHMMMLEKNNLAIARVLADWTDTHVK